MVKYGAKKRQEAINAIEYVCSDSNCDDVRTCSSMGRSLVDILVSLQDNLTNSGMALIIKLIALVVKLIIKPKIAVWMVVSKNN